jgi:tetratricopeptide (TPR) repeat protein
MNVDELTRKALEASAHEDSEGAITCLKEAIEVDGQAALPRYLLGAEYAQIGLIDRAVAEMSRAVSSDPGLAIARFQLGLLHLTSGRVEEAAATWQRLDALGELHPLRLFKEGLLQMARDRFAEAKFLIEEGLARHSGNTPLDADMRKVLAQIERAEAPGDGAGSEHILLSAYRGTRE